MTQIAANPRIGTCRLLRYPKARIFPVGDVLMLYQPLSDERGIEFICVMHGARDWERLFADHPDQ